MDYNSTYKDLYNKRRYGSCCEKGEKGDTGEPGIPGPPGKDGVITGDIASVSDICLNHIDAINSTIKIGNTNTTTTIFGNLIANDLSLNTLSISGESLNDFISSLNNSLKSIPLDISLSNIDISGDTLTIGPSSANINILGKLINNDISSNYANLKTISCNTLSISGEDFNSIIRNIDTGIMSIPSNLSLNVIDISGSNLDILNGNVDISGDLNTNNLSVDTLTISGETIEEIIARKEKYDISLSSIDVSGENLTINGSICVANSFKSFDVSTNSLSTNSLDVSGEDILNIITNTATTIADSKISAGIPQTISINQIDVCGNTLTIGPSTSSVNITSNKVITNDLCSKKIDASNIRINGVALTIGSGGNTVDIPSDINVNKIGIKSGNTLEIGEDTKIVNIKGNLIAPDISSNNINSTNIQLNGVQIESLIDDKIDNKFSSKSYTNLEISGNKLTIGDTNHEVEIKGKLISRDLSTNTLTISGETVEQIIKREKKYDISLSSIDVSGENLTINGATVFNNYVKIPDLSTNTLTISGETVEQIIEREKKYDISLSSIDVSGDKLVINGSLSVMGGVETNERSTNIIKTTVIQTQDISLNTINSNNSNTINVVSDIVDASNTDFKIKDISCSNILCSDIKTDTFFIDSKEFTKDDIPLYCRQYKDIEFDSNGEYSFFNNFNFPLSLNIPDLSKNYYIVGKQINFKNRFIYDFYTEINFVKRFSPQNYMKIIKYRDNSQNLADTSDNRKLDLVIKIIKKPKLWTPPKYTLETDFSEIDTNGGFLGVAFNDILNSYDIFINWKDCSSSLNGLDIIPVFKTNYDFLQQNKDYSFNDSNSNSIDNGLDGIEFTIKKEFFDIIDSSSGWTTNDEITFGFSDNNSDTTKSLASIEDDSSIMPINYIKCGIRIKKTVLELISRKTEITATTDESGLNIENIGDLSSDIKIRIVKGKSIDKNLVIDNVVCWRIMRLDGNNWNDTHIETTTPYDQSIFDSNSGDFNLNHKKVALSLCIKKHTMTPQSFENETLELLELITNIKGVKYHDDGTSHYYETVPLIKEASE